MRTGGACASTGHAAALTGSSDAFENGQPIPLKHSAYDQGASFSLRWSAGPEGTYSYVVIMEDPDVRKPPKPFIHWIAWNIPANVLALREGLQAQDRLTGPNALRRGPNTPGRIGYYGPKPPAGDREDAEGFFAFGEPHWCGGTVSVLGVYADWLRGSLFGDAFDRGLTFKLGQTHVQAHLPELLDRIETVTWIRRSIVPHRRPLAEASRVARSSTRSGKIASRSC